MHPSPDHRGSTTDSGEEVNSAVVVELLDLQKVSTRFDWIGIYWLQGQTLVLGEFLGERPVHDTIAVGQGVCGTAVSENQDQIVPDVSERENYLSCGLGAKSELVVLIRNQENQIVGQIDIDSKTKGNFTHKELDAVRNLARKLGERWKK